jgi:hypothetical protein
MTDSSDYRLYLEENFREIKDDLKEIKMQVTKTNGTVQEHEKYIVYADNVIKIRGEQSKDFESQLSELHKDLEEYRIIKKYPKASVILLVVAIIGAMISLVSLKVGIVRLKQQVDMINTPVRTRAGHIEFWPSGVVIDSLNEGSTK